MWWLHDHHHAFESLTREKLGDQATREIDWSAPRIVCVAGAFTRHDTVAVAVELIGHRVDLVTYRIFQDVLALQLISSASGDRTSQRGKTSGSACAASLAPKSVPQYLDESPHDLKELYADLDELLLSHQDVLKEPQLHYIAYRRIMNVATVRVQPRNRLFVVNLRLDPQRVELRETFCRDMRGLGALGIRDGVEVRIGSREDLARATELIQRSIEAV